MDACPMRRKDVMMSSRPLHCRCEQLNCQAELMWSGGQSQVDNGEALCPDCRRMEDERYR